MADLYATVEKEDHRVVRVWLNPSDYASLRKHGRDSLEIESSALKLKQGIMGILWGAEIRVSRKITDGFTVLISDADGDSDLTPEWNPEKLVRI
jgi:hypothetical protein